MNSVLEQIANLRSGRWNGIAIPHRFALLLALSGPYGGVQGYPDQLGWRFSIV